MKETTALALVIGLALGVLLTQTFDDPVARGCLPIPDERPAAAAPEPRPATAELACAHWMSTGQGWRCA